jgi:hypothetical protein
VPGDGELWTLDLITGDDADERAARDAMAKANDRYVQARASGSPAEPERLALVDAIRKWEARFLQVARNDFGAQNVLSLDKRIKALAHEQAQDAALSALGQPRRSKGDHDPRLGSARMREYSARRSQEDGFSRLRREYGIPTALDQPYGFGVPVERPVDTGHYDDGHSLAWPTKKLAISKPLVAALIAAAAAIAAGAFLLFGGGGKSGGSAASVPNASGGPAEAAATPTRSDSASTPVVPALDARGTPIAANAATKPILSGDYQENVQIKQDGAGHGPFVGMPEQIKLNLLVDRDLTTGLITITMTGPPPWVALSGSAQFGPSFTVSGGNFDASGEGTVAGRSAVKVDFSGSVIAGTGLQGDLSMGTNGALPTGQAITYSLNGTKQ